MGSSSEKVVRHFADDRFGEEFIGLLEREKAGSTAPVISSESYDKYIAALVRRNEKQIVFDQIISLVRGLMIEAQRSGKLYTPGNNPAREE